jgi:hypothetical protein
MLPVVRRSRDTGIFGGNGQGTKSIVLNLSQKAQNARRVA